MDHLGQELITPILPGLPIHSDSHLVTLLRHQISTVSHHIPRTRNIHKQLSYSEHSKSANLGQRQIVIRIATKIQSFVLCFYHQDPPPPPPPIKFHRNPFITFSVMLLKANRQANRQTNKRYQKYNLLCQGGNNALFVLYIY